MSHDDLKYRRAEEQYFLEQNQELIKRLHAEKAEKEAQAEHQSHLGKCHKCGDSMSSMTFGSHSFMCCERCELASVPATVLREMLASGKGRNELAHLAEALTKRRLKTA